MQLLLRGKYRVTELKGKTQAILFKEISEGDILSFEAVVDYNWNPRRINIRNDNTGEVITRYTKQLLNVLTNNFELEVVG